MSTNQQADLAVNSDASVLQPKAKKRDFKKLLKRDKYLLILLLPGVIYFLIFMYAPMVGLVISFENYSPFRGVFAGPWVGLKWLQQFFSSPFCGRVIRNTILLNIYGLLWGFSAPIIFALLLNEIRNRKFKRISQTISYLPHFISTVVIIGILGSLLSPDTGIINFAIKALGGTPINFMASAKWFRTMYISSDIWQGIGWGAIIYLAAIAGINPELYEAALVDGASKFQQIWYVTLPCILPTIMIMLIMSLGSMFALGPEKIILMYNTNTYPTADVISTYVYRRGIVNSEYSFGTAVSLFQSAINFVLVIVVNKISKTLSETSLW